MQIQSINNRDKIQKNTFKGNVIPLGTLKMDRVFSAFRFKFAPEYPGGDSVRFANNLLKDSEMLPKLNSEAHQVIKNLDGSKIFDSRTSIIEVGIGPKPDDLNLQIITEGHNEAFLLDEPQNPFNHTKNVLISFLEKSKTLMDKKESKILDEILKKLKGNS